MKKAKEAGQATIEFIFVLAFGLSLMLMIFNSAMNYATGYLVHYATFMASRVYMTSESYYGNFTVGYDGSLGRAEENARAAFRQYNLGIFGIQENEFFVNKVTSGQSSSEYLTVGAYSRYTQKVDLLGKVAGNTELDMVSESFLGHEPTRVGCAIRTCMAITGREVCDESMDITLFDDGC
ncbi:MAG: hypothetical protein ACJ76H_04315 [Bacteriovoracaceae bacterium]